MPPGVGRGGFFKKIKKPIITNHEILFFPTCREKIKILYLFHNININLLTHF
jgi:hypothetical protein